jgi:hypothetical protein
MCTGMKAANTSGQEDQMKAIFWTIAIMAIALFGLSGIVDQLAGMF